jgi:ureidoglycolate hydrolase
MDQTHRPIEALDPDAFAPFGVLITRPGRHGDGWYDVVIEEAASPWKIAVYEFDRRGTTRLENHPTSKESFEPLTGVGLLIVAPPGAPEDWRVFLLDQSVCLYEKVWHQVVSLSAYAQVKITENIAVTSEFHDFADELRPVMAGYPSPNETSR